MPSTIVLSDENREALIIRCRRILVLSLIDHFNANNEFGKLIAKELMDMFEGLIKALAESLEISLYTDQNNSNWKPFGKIFEELENDSRCHFINEIKEINSKLSSTAYFNSLRQQFRNDETHYLNLPEIPRETIIRVWRYFFQSMNLIDAELLNESKSRSEFNDFFYLHDFFNKVILEGNSVKIDLNRLKKEKVEIEVPTDTGPVMVEKEFERGILEIIEEIKIGNFLEESELEECYPN